MMPDRKCSGCVRQAEWGCKAKPHPVFDDNGKPVLDMGSGLPLRDENGVVVKEFGKVVIDPRSYKQKIAWSDPAIEASGFDGEEEWWACPRQDLFENQGDWSRLMLVFAMFKKGHLPASGSATDQSNRAMQILNIIDIANEECSYELRQREIVKNRGR